MKIGIVQVDGEYTDRHGITKRFPNMALMQICGYHESQGDTVEWYKGGLFADEYDMVYVSKIFSFSKMPADLPAGAMIGGTGIDFKNKLPDYISGYRPSWTLYPDIDFHIGFTMKGCRFNCDFCCVPQKEGRPKLNSDIDQLLTNPSGRNRLMLLDNDFFGGPNWRVDIIRIIELKLRVCFVQGLNIRIITPEQAELLAQCNYQNSKFHEKYLTFAWDRFYDGKLIMKGIEICNNAGIPSSKMQFFILIGYNTTPKQDLERVTVLRDLGCLPYVMPFNRSDPYQKAFARWVNKRAIFRSCTWEQYKYNESWTRQN